MRKIIIFPGQGYQNKEMLLPTDVQNFCLNHHIGDLLNSFLEDNARIKDTKYAQSLIIATQLAELNRYKQTQSPDTEYVYCGFSLGEITALIASGAIDINEGLQFARQRGELCKDFCEDELQANISSEQRTFSVAKIDYHDGLEEDIYKFNLKQPYYEKINITNYIPSSSAMPFKLAVTITGESKTLRDALDSFLKSPNAKAVPTQCPFHSEALMRFNT